MTHTPIPTNFLYPDVKATAYRFGSGQLTGTPLREDGNWSDYLPPQEDQNIRGIESSACYVEASQHSIATIQEEQFNLPDQNYSARFNTLLSNSTIFGGDPIAGGQSIRHDGLIPDAMMPFGSSVQSWDDFHSWKDVNKAKCLLAGLDWLKKWKPEYDIVFTREESVEAKYAKLRNALKYCPCPISVTAWYEDDGVYVKPAGSIDNHLVEAVYLDEQNRLHIRDTYAPYEKVLEPYFNFDFCLRWSLAQLSTPEFTSNWLWNMIRSLKEFFKDMFYKW